MFSFKRLINSFRHAFFGIWYTFRQEQSFRVQIVVALAVIGLMFYFKIKSWEKITLFLVVTMVLVLELINTVIERFIDILKPRIHNYVRDIKDIMAAIVLISSIGAVVIGFLIFWPYLFNNIKVLK